MSANDIYKVANITNTSTPMNTTSDNSKRKQPPSSQLPTATTKPRTGPQTQEDTDAAKLAKVKSGIEQRKADDKKKKDTADAAQKAMELASKQEFEKQQRAQQKAEEAAKIKRAEQAVLDAKQANKEAEDQREQEKQDAIKKTTEEAVQAKRAAEQTESKKQDEIKKLTEEKPEEDAKKNRNSDIAMVDPVDIKRLLAAFPTTKHTPQHHKPTADHQLIFLVLEKSSTEDQSPLTLFGQDVIDDPQFRGMRPLQQYQENRSNHQQTQRDFIAFAFIDDEGGNALRHKALTAPGNQTDKGHPKAIINYTNFKHQLTYEHMEHPRHAAHAMASNVLLPRAWTEKKITRAATPANGPGKGSYARGRGGNKNTTTATNTEEIIQNPTGVVQQFAYEWALANSSPFYPFLSKAKTKPGHEQRWNVQFAFKADPRRERELLHSYQADLEHLRFGPNEGRLFADLLPNPHTTTGPWRICDCQSGKECLENGECFALPPNWKRLKRYILTADYSNVYNRSDYPKQPTIPFLYNANATSFKEAYASIVDYWNEQGLPGVESMTCIIQPRKFPMVDDEHDHPLHSIYFYVSLPEILQMQPITDILDHINSNQAGLGEFIFARDMGGSCWRCGGDGHQAKDCRITPNLDPHHQMHHHLSARSICRTSPCINPHCDRAHYGMDLNNDHPGKSFTAHTWERASNQTEDASQTPNPPTQADPKPKSAW
jgi:hypothetical protein